MSHLHPLAPVRKPPATGPMTGPSVGPRAYIPMNFPRRSCGIRSEIVPPPIARGADPAQPCRKRRAIRLFRLGASAQATVKAAKMVLHE